MSFLLLNDETLDKNEKCFKFTPSDFTQATP